MGLAVTQSEPLCAERGIVRIPGNETAVDALNYEAVACGSIRAGGVAPADAMETALRTNRELWGLLTAFGGSWCHSWGFSAPIGETAGLPATRWSWQRIFSTVLAQIRGLLNRRRSC